MAAYEPSAPGVAGNGTIVTPGTQVFDPPLTSLWIGGTGSLVATMAQSGTITLIGVPVGMLNLAVVNVGTATSCTNIVGFW